MRAGALAGARVLLAGVVPLLLVIACGDDDPTASGAAEIELASVSYNSTSSGPVAPDLPLVASVTFGVESDPPDPTTDYPEPLIFGEYEMKQGDRRVHTALSAAGFPIVASRLTDGVDESTFVGIAINGNGYGGMGGSESSLLESPPSLDRPAPDFAGYAVTSIEVAMTELSASESGGTWTQKVSFTVTIRGHKR